MQNAHPFQWRCHHYPFPFRSSASCWVVFSSDCSSSPIISSMWFPCSWSTPHWWYRDHFSHLPCCWTDSLALWHCPLGHLGIDATQAILTKDYVTGVNWSGTVNFSDCCVLCLIAPTTSLFTSSASCLCCLWITALIQSICRTCNLWLTWWNFGFIVSLRKV